MFVLWQGANYCYYRPHGGVFFCFHFFRKGFLSIDFRMMSEDG